MNNWLVVYLPLWKWWISSVGMMKFPTEWKVIKTMFQTTNQINYHSMQILILREIHIRFLIKSPCSSLRKSPSNSNADAKRLHRTERRVIPVKTESRPGEWPTSQRSRCGFHAVEVMKTCSAYMSYGAPTCNVVNPIINHPKITIK